MFLLILNSKVKHNKNDKLNDFIFHKYQDLMYDYLVNNNFHTSLVPRLRYMKSYENLLLKYTYVISGEQVKANVKAYAEQYFTDYYRNMLKQKKWAHKVNAINAIVQFNMSTLTDEVCVMFHDKEIRNDLELSSQILKIVVMNDYKKFRVLYSKYIIDIAPFQYRQLCKYFTDEQWDIVVKYFSNFQYEWQLNTIDCIGLFNVQRLEKFVEDYAANKLWKTRHELGTILEKKLQEYNEHVSLIGKNIKKSRKKYLGILRDKLELEMDSIKQKQSDLNEMIIRCLKTLSLIGYTVDINALSIYMHSNIWQERLMMIRMIGKVRAGEWQHYLIEALADPNFYLRNEALKSLILVYGNNDKMKQLYEVGLEDECSRDIVADYLKGCGIHV